MVVSLVAAGFRFKMVPQMFFPASARTQFMVDYWAPEGTRIQTVSHDIRALEEYLLQDDRVWTASARSWARDRRGSTCRWIRSRRYQSYGQLIVNTTRL